MTWEKNHEASSFQKIGKAKIKSFRKGKEESFHG